MTNTDYIINRIIEANESNTLAIFVGAGLSKASDTKSYTLPSWNDLIVDLKKELNLENENDFLKIAQLYYLSVGGFSYYKKIKKYFSDTLKPSDTHKLLFRINPHVVITTNWDNLLEKTIQENAFVYDVICSDKDLVKSVLEKKIIKMHGDFKNHNIVFKEDDYINYAYNFPLIENYIKSILSTHTVLFVGYSYSDIDLKHILKWIQNNSDVRPPMYLAVFDDDPIQKRYLENHGITTLVLNSNNVTSFGINKTYEIHQLLNKIYTKNSDAIITDQKEVVDFLFKKISILNEENYILLEQIQKTLTNSGFVYEPDAKPVLVFYDKLLTADYNNNIRNIYKSFLNILSSLDTVKPDTKIQQIYEIFAKAGLKGIGCEADTPFKDNRKFYTIKIDLDSTSNFVFDSITNFRFQESLSDNNLSLKNICDAYFKYQNKEYEEALVLLDRGITDCLIQKKYTWLFIASFNRNVIIRSLKYGFGFKKDYYDLSENKLEELFDNLPYETKKAIMPLYDFLNFDYLYRYSFSIDEVLRKKEETAKNVKSGGFAFDSESFKAPSEHINLINFAIRNFIMIDNFTEYRNIQRRFISISISRQVQSANISFSKIELFTCVKYINNKELKELLNICYTKDKEKQKFLEILEEDKTWLIDKVFKNIVFLYANSKNIFNNHEDYLKNILFILSLVQLSNTDLENCLMIITELISSASNSMDIYQSVNLFLGIQYNLYNSQFDTDKLINLSEVMIQKIVDHKCNGYEYLAFTRNEISNLYGYAKYLNAKFTNQRLIARLLDEFSNLPADDKIDISQSLLLNIYQIATDLIKNDIKDFILSIDSKNSTHKHKSFIFELSLVISDLKTIDDISISELNAYVNTFVDSKMFSSALYTLNSQITYLVKEKGFESLSKIEITLCKIIENYNANKMISNF